MKKYNSKERSLYVSFSILIMFSLSACDKDIDGEISSYDIATTVESGLAGIGGTIDESSNEDDHNLAGYTATMTPSNVTYTSGCCYPTA